MKKGDVAVDQCIKRVFQLIYIYIDISIYISCALFCRLPTPISLNWQFFSSGSKMFYGNFGRNFEMEAKNRDFKKQILIVFC